MRKKHVSKQINSGAVTRKATPEEIMRLNAIITQEAIRLKRCKSLNLSCSNAHVSNYPGNTL